MGISVFETIPKNIGYFIITAVSFSSMCASTTFDVSMMTAAQQQTPTNLLGKIMAVIIAVSSCSQPVGQAVYGVLFDVFADKSYLVMIGAAIWLWRFRCTPKRVLRFLKRTPM